MNIWKVKKFLDYKIDNTFANIDISVFKFILYMFNSSIVYNIKNYLNINILYNI